ncbi:MAG: hypothetical protein E7218_04865 [Anaerofustis stercorihominis]|nr:hypothetical protein [Anaerofustis stercorihominis]
MNKIIPTTILFMLLLSLTVAGCSAGNELIPLAPENASFDEALFGITEEEFIGKMGALELTERTDDDETQIKTYFTQTQEDDNFTSFRAYGFVEDKLCMQRYSAELKVLDGDYTKEEVYDNFEITIENFVSFIEENYAMGEFTGTYSDLRPGVTGSWPVGESADIQMIATISDDIENGFGHVSLYYTCDE